MWNFHRPSVSQLIAITPVTYLSASMTYRNSEHKKERKVLLFKMLVNLPFTTGLKGESDYSLQLCYSLHILSHLSYVKNSGFVIRNQKHFRANVLPPGIPLPPPPPGRKKVCWLGRSPGGSLDLDLSSHLHFPPTPNCDYILTLFFLKFFWNAIIISCSAIAISSVIFFQHLCLWNCLIHPVLASVTSPGRGLPFFLLHVI